MRALRLALRALIELTESRDVILVALTRAEAVEVARKVCKLAKALKIPCSNVDEQSSGGRVSVRAYSEPPKLKRFDRPTSVLFMSEFTHGGEWSGVGLCRLIVTSDDGRVPAASGEGSERAIDKPATTGLP